MNKFFGLTLAVATLVPSVAFADTNNDGPREQRVSYADLNILSPEGQKTFDRRLVAAARSVCDSMDQGNLGAMAGADECRRMTLVEARRHARMVVASALGTISPAELASR